MPSTDHTILCTGPVDASLVQIAREKNIILDEIHFTETSPAITPAVETQIRAVLKQETTVVFTSSNAIKAILPFVQDQHPRWTIYCIGFSTLESAKKQFGAASIRQSAGNAADLAKKIVAGANTREVTFFCGDRRRDDLPAALAKKNIDVHEIIVYNTKLLPRTITKEYDAVLFFSPSAAESFFSNNRLNEKTVAFVMGKTTADVIRDFCGNTIVTGHEPVKSQLVGTAIDFVRKKA